MRPPNTAPRWLILPGPRFQGGGNTIETLIARAAELGDRLLVFFGETATLVQLMIVALVLLIARVAQWRLGPRVEERVRAIPDPDHNLLRILSIFLRRLEWVFFVILGGIALLLMQV